MWPGSIVPVVSTSVAVGETVYSLSPVFSLTVALPDPVMTREAPSILTSSRMLEIIRPVLSFPPLAMTVPSTTTVSSMVVTEPLSRTRARWPSASIFRLSERMTVLFSPPALMAEMESALSTMWIVPFVAVRLELPPTVMALVVTS